MKKLVNDKVFKVFTITAMCLGMPLVVTTGLMLAGEDISSSARLFVKIDGIICSIIIIGCLIWFIVDPITDVMQNWVTKRNRAKQTVIPCEDEEEEDGEEDTTLQTAESVQPLKDIDDEVGLFKQQYICNEFRNRPILECFHELFKIDANRRTNSYILFYCAQEIGWFISIPPYAHIERLFGEKNVGSKQIYSRAKSLASSEAYSKTNFDKLRENKKLLRETLATLENSSL